jgi:hypothetical protein
MRSAPTQPTNPPNCGAHNQDERLANVLMPSQNIALWRGAIPASNAAPHPDVTGDGGERSRSGATSHCAPLLASRRSASPRRKPSPHPPPNINPSRSIDEGTRQLLLHSTQEQLAVAQARMAALQDNRTARKHRSPFLPSSMGALATIISPLAPLSYFSYRQPPVLLFHHYVCTGAYAHIPAGHRQRAASRSCSGSHTFHCTGT